MEAPDIRIGNLVYRNNIIETISMVSDNDYCTKEHGHGIENNDLEPITLTEDQLTMFGLKIETLNGDRTQGVVGVYPDLPNEIHYIIDIYPSEYGDYNYITKQIKFIHELQNLHYVLKGTELTPKSAG